MHMHLVLFISNYGFFNHKFFNKQRWSINFFPPHIHFEQPLFKLMSWLNVDPHPREMNDFRRCSKYVLCHQHLIARKVIHKTGMRLLVQAYKKYRKCVILLS